MATEEKTVHDKEGCWFWLYILSVNLWM